MQLYNNLVFFNTKHGYLEKRSAFINTTFRFSKYNIHIYIYMYIVYKYYKNI